ncbi:nucleotidyltransferase domain-containing protein [Candidatus Woesearchaeota archaeon]|nr:nucleotidyltransferase domain-containing protein [Candidatus Woesearchaeota archaeon]
MKQKLYNTILNLLNGDNHLRQIAKDIKTNHMTVKRALDILIKENVLDVRKEGKNSIYSIKKTLEAQNFVFMAEIYKFNSLIKKHPELKQDLKELKKLHINIIAVFGSYAKSIETDKSDIDMYIETQNGKIKREASKINRKFSIKTGLYAKDSLLIKEIEKNHIIVKGVEIFYEKNKFFD